MGVGMGAPKLGTLGPALLDGVGDVSDLLDMFLPYTVYCVTTPNSVIQ